MKINKLLLLLLTTFSSIIAFSQEKKIDVNVSINKNGNVSGAQWYMQPWVWVVGGAIFILLIVIIVKGEKKAQ
ncbi:hypothetical protein LK994_14450 [Ferruginibacter lapsinanis]|uniref:hypothetical protein n=1 Tax=Ferruginibacter lapsinanis TaxID=563172 RepID=UPI001E430E84|nr:hypothetical protein [Ferruginibacter lapsinanis]UEG49838.1 hypothetical protein LK994_14450 [Ferruginibacter lapsinanis]